MTATEIRAETSSQADLFDTPPYSLTIMWDSRDNIFVVSSKEWPGNHTHGSSYEEALAAGRDMLAGLAEIAKERGQSLPPVAQFSRDTF